MCSKSQLNLHFLKLLSLDYLSEVITNNYLIKSLCMNSQISDIAIKYPRIIGKQTAKVDRIPLRNNPAISNDADYYIKEFIDEKSENVVVVNSKERTDFDIFLNIKYNSVINLQRVNDIRYINKYFEKVNSILPQSGLFVGTFESSQQRYNRIMAKYPKIQAYGFYFSTFILKRIFPKWSITKKIYFFLTKGKNRYLSLAEVLGRLFSCGFEIIDHHEMSSNTFFVAKKVKEPSFDKTPSYGPFFKMKRIGKNGKQIKVYKLRTMHPYAEYLQSYIYKNNNLSNGGKFNGDFRITTWGKFFRKYWIDELPMFINFFKGELKLIGVRPLSEHYLSLYSKELRELRLKTKPGLVPPYYADMPNSLDEIMKSEENYLNQYFQKPISTDIKYFWKAFCNILFSRARSG